MHCCKIALYFVKFSIPSLFIFFKTIEQQLMLPWEQELLFYFPPSLEMINLHHLSSTFVTLYYIIQCLVTGLKIGEWFVESPKFEVALFE